MQQLVPSILFLYYVFIPILDDLSKACCFKEDDFVRMKGNIVMSTNKAHIGTVKTVNSDEESLIIDFPESSWCGRASEVELLPTLEMLRKPGEACGKLICNWLFLSIRQIVIRYITNILK